MNASRTSRGMLLRIAAVLVGVLTLLGAAVISMGAALLAPIGMWVLVAYRRKHHRSTTRTATWTAAMSWVAAGLLGMTLVALDSLPAGSIHQIQHAADSASVAHDRTPPPAWVERMAPGTSARMTQGPPTPASLRAPIMIWTAGVMLLLMSALVGSIAWAGTMLCGFGLGGRWPNDPLHGYQDDASAKPGSAFVS